MISIIVKVMKAIYKQRVAMDRINQKNLDGTTKNFQVTILVSSKYLRVKSCIFGSSQTPMMIVTIAYSGGWITNSWKLLEALNFSVSKSFP